ncbi:DUF721 domain-containing protein [Candidatus Enterovibrio escicola]|nr:DciA family protein [Candidatus Enterovibrio escacola]
MRDHRPQATLDLLKNSTTGSVHRRAIALLKLNMQLQALLPEQPAKHCRVANFRDGILVIECGSSSWGTRLNYDRQTLISALRKEALPSLSTIEIKVNPELAKSTAKKVTYAPIQQRTVSHISAEYLRDVTGIVPEKIKKKLEAIATLLSNSDSTE